MTVTDQCAPEADPGVWDRWMPLWHITMYVVLVPSTVFALVDGQADPGYRIAVLALSAFAGLWYWAMIVRHPERVDSDLPGAVRLYLGVGVLLFVALISLSSIFYFLASCYYMQIFRFLRVRWAIPVAISLGLAMLAHQVAVWGPSVLSHAGTIAGVAVPLALGIAITLYIRAIIGESIQRRDLIAELERTRQDLAASEREAGVLEERQRLAREIHDTLAQSLVSIIMNLEAAESLLPAGSEPLRHAVVQARQTARDALTEARRSVSGLRPAALEEASLSEAVRRTAERWSAETHLAAHVTVTGTRRPLHPAQDITLLRAVQEALANVARHARARQAGVTISYLDDAVILDVHDDGTGLAGSRRHAPEPNGGFGLVAMRERAAELGGSLSIESSEAGTTLTLMLPLSPAATGDPQAPVALGHGA